MVKVVRYHVIDASLTLVITTVWMNAVIVLRDQVQFRLA